MSKPSKKVRCKERYDLDYAETKQMVQECGGWLQTGGPEGTYINVWWNDTDYEIRGEALIFFLHVVKDVNNTRVRAALDLIEYIEEAAEQPPSVYVRDAIVGRARALKAAIRGEQA